MAQRRMFSLKVVDTDAFLDMPQSSQLLYYSLAMRADDDGFIANPKKIMRMLGSQDDDYKVLVVKKFVIPFESGVCVIKHWLIHNLIRGDRYIETQYTREKSQLVIDDQTSKYSLNKGENNVIPNGNQMAPQVRLGKVRLGKNTNAETSSAEIFSLKDEIQKLEDSARRDLQIIGYYLAERKPDIRTKEQLGRAIKRHLLAAKELTAFEDDQLVSGFKKAKAQTSEWVLETVVKMLTK